MTLLKTDKFNRIGQPETDKSRLLFSDRYLARYLSELFESEFSKVQSDGLRFYIRDQIVTVYGTLFDPVDHERIMYTLGNALGIEAIIDRMHIVEDVYQDEIGSGLAMMFTDTPEPRHFLPA